MAPMTITLQVDPDQEYKISGKLVEMKSRISSEARRICEKLNKDPKNFCFTKLSRGTNMYISTELKGLKHGDVLKLILENPADSQRLKFTEEKNKMIIEKLHMNAHLTGTDRLYICEFFNLHRNCSLASNNAASITFDSEISNGVLDHSKKRKLANITENAILPAVSREIKKSDKQTQKSNQIDTSNKRVQTVPLPAIPKSVSTETSKNRKSDTHLEHSKRRKLTDMKNNYVQTVPINTENQETQVNLLNDSHDLKQYVMEQYNLPTQERDWDKFTESFEALFKDRRDYIMSAPPLVKDVKKLHPYLFERKQVFKEFELITQRENLYIKYKKNVEKYSKYILKATPNSPYKNKIMDAIMEAGKHEDKKWIRMAGSLYLLPKYMCEDRRCIILLDHEDPVENTNHPFIKFNANFDTSLSRSSTKFQVLIEGIELCKAQNIVDAFYGLMAAYYIFNVEYPLSGENTFYLFERLYTEHSDNTPELSDDVKEKIQLLEKHSR